jgi:hypothetical protein
MKRWVLSRCDKTILRSEADSKSLHDKSSVAPLYAVPLAAARQVPPHDHGFLKVL